jgi:hypothetical protein
MQRAQRIRCALAPPHVRERYLRSMDWVVSRIHLFTPSDITDAESMKESTELALFYCLGKLWHPSTGERELAAIREHLWQWLSDRLLIQWLAKCPGHYSPSAVAYLALRATGERIAAFEDLLRRLRSAGFPQCLELTPYRVLELQYVLWKSGLAKRKPALGPHFRASSLALARNPIYLNESEVYSITHTVIYLTDFAGPCDLPPPIRQRALDMVRPLLVHFRRAGNWDITGELLLNLIGLDSGDDPLFAANMQALCSVQWPDGTVPGPHYSPADSQAAGGDYIFKNCYHTTLVSMMLWAAYLHRATASN